MFKNKILSKEQEKELAIKIKQGDIDALHRLVLANSLLVYHFANRYCIHGLPRDDLVSEGFIALVKAAKLFDPARKVKFGTYATFSIRRAMIKASVEQCGIVKLPYGKSSILFKIKKAQGELTSSFNYFPSNHEVAEHLHLSLDEVETITSTVNDHYELFENYDDPIQASQLVNILKKEEINLIAQEIENLPPRLKEIIIRNYGLDGCAQESYTDIGKSMRLSRSRIGQLHQEAIDTIKDEVC